MIVDIAKNKYHCGTEGIHAVATHLDEPVMFWQKDRRGDIGMAVFKHGPSSCGHGLATTCIWDDAIGMFHTDRRPLIVVRVQGASLSSDSGHYMWLQWVAQPSVGVTPVEAFTTKNVRYLLRTTVARAVDAVHLYKTMEKKFDDDAAAAFTAPHLEPKRRLRKRTAPSDSKEPSTRAVTKKPRSRSSTKATVNNSGRRTTRAQHAQSRRQLRSGTNNNQ